MISPPLRRVLVRGAGVSLVLVAFASCGSRTGLFGPESGPSIDASTIDVRDAGIDVRQDDAARDAPGDVIEEKVACIPGTFSFSVATSQILFVLDRSGSMAYLLDRDAPAPAGVTSRWTALRDALDQTLRPFAAQIEMGARFYPRFDANLSGAAACQQDNDSEAITPDLNNADAILEVFDRTRPIGGTPTALALDRAATQQSTRRAVARAMVLATDGAPNCNTALDPKTCVCSTSATTNCANGLDGANCLDDARTVDAVRRIATTQSIPVFIVGIGVLNNAGATLDAMAVAGGRPRQGPPGSPRYYPATTPAELTTAFTAVRDSVSRCSYITPSAPEDPSAITVNIAGVPVLRDETHTNGWDWIDKDYGYLQLFGPACAQASAVNVGGTVLCEKPEGGD